MLIIPSFTFFLIPARKRSRPNSLGSASTPRFVVPSKEGDRRQIDIAVAWFHATYRKGGGPRMRMTDLLDEVNAYMHQVPEIQPFRDWKTVTPEYLWFRYECRIDSSTRCVRLTMPVHANSTSEISANQEPALQDHHGHGVGDQLMDMHAGSDIDVVEGTPIIGVGVDSTRNFDMPQL